MIVSLSIIRSNWRLLRDHRLRFVIPLVLISLLFSCTRHPHSTSNHLYEILVNGKRILVEVASTYEERKQGLMYRDKLGKDSGMLFIFPQEKQLSFWMKNTKIPLSIAFIDSRGEITQIDSMTPYSTTSHTSKDQVKYALEMEDKWFSKNRIAVGTKVDFSSRISSINESE
ncbi:MAG: DUF192 domain-containing protein [Planctomycetes bacterium]|nr:DUF192 domain-containing protein [Planctomycetota bacterium]